MVTKHPVFTAVLSALLSILCLSCISQPPSQGTSAFTAAITPANAELQTPNSDAAEAGNSGDSANGKYRVTYLPEFGSVPLNRIHSWKLKVYDLQAQTPIHSLKIDVSGGMPAHTHGLPTRPVVVGQTEPGIYLVQGMKFHMPGLWEVTFKIEGKSDIDYIVFQLTI